MPLNLFTENQSLSSVLPLRILAAGRFSNYPRIAVAAGRASRTAPTWPTANLAVYSPVSLSAPFTVSRFLLVNGVTTGNVDLGLYSEDGKLLISTGSTARSGSNSIQYISVTPTPFPAGKYYIAIVIASTSGSVNALNINNSFLIKSCGFLQEALGSNALPATMTPVAYTGASAIMYGFTQSATL